MRKYQIMLFQIFFVQQIKLGQGGKSFLIQKGKILHDWQGFQWQKIEIDIIENQIFKTLIDGHMGLILDLIPFRYKGIT